jgi:hypothetical protein
MEERMILKIMLLVRILGSILIAGAVLSALTELYVSLALNLAWTGVLFILASCAPLFDPKKKHPL